MKKTLSMDVTDLYATFNICEQDYIKISQMYDTLVKKPSKTCYICFFPLWQLELNWNHLFDWVS